MNCKIHQNEYGVAVVIIDDDGLFHWTTESNEQYLAWLAEGNEPEPWEGE